MSSSPVGHRDSRSSDGWAAAAVFLVAVVVLGSGLSAEPSFADEWAYISQAYFLDDLAHRDHPRWLAYPAFDLPPLPKYFIGLSLRADGFALPQPDRALAWYRDTSSTFGDRAMLVAARRPSVFFGAIGCVALFALGTLAVSRHVGVVAALGLMLNPLYAQQARRAMSDVYAEAMILCCAAVGLLAWSRILAGRYGLARGLTTLLVSGAFGGLAVLSKFNGGLGLMTLGAWGCLALALPRLGWRPKGIWLAGMVAAGASALSIFVALNPFVTARPRMALAPEFRALAERGVVARCRFLIEHRLDVPRQQQSIFPHNALPSLTDKIPVMAVQGFGRFGPLGRKRYDSDRGIWWFDSTRRYDWGQDWGALAWIPIVALGAAWYARAGYWQWASGHPPTCWAVLTQSALALVTVTAFLPLAWDRFFLSVQPGSCLMGAGILVATATGLARRVRGSGRSRDDVVAAKGEAAR